MTIIEGTELTPQVTFNANEAIFKIEGESSPENPKEFYNTIFIKIDELSSQYKNIVFEFDLNYFNSSSLKFIYKIVEKIFLLNKNNETAAYKVCWTMYDDDINIKSLFQNFTTHLSIMYK